MLSRLLMARTRLKESDSTRRLRKPRSVARSSASRTASPSATRGEITLEMFLDPVSNLRPVESVKIHPNPAIPVSLFQAASELTVIELESVGGGVIWGRFGAGEAPDFASRICADCHSLAPRMAFKAVSAALNVLLENISWFLAVQRFQKTHGAIGPNPTPVGGRQVSEAEAPRESAKEL